MSNKRISFQKLLSAVFVLAVSFGILAFPARAQAKKSVIEKFMDSTKEGIKKTEEAMFQGKTVIFKGTDGQADDKKNNDKDQKNEKKDKHDKTEKNNKEDNKEVPEETHDLGEIEKEAHYASEKTGVSKDFLMGMLVVESSLGQNTGQCTYQEVEEDARRSHDEGKLSDRAWQTFLERKETIQNIADDLGYDPERIKVSCNPANYTGTGGAMGPGQFMPDTWLEYKDRVAEVVGKQVPDPWDARDGVVAMALKVADVPGVTQKDIWCEKVASKLYLSGTTSWQYNWYANAIQYWKYNYQKLLG